MSFYFDHAATSPMTTSTLSFYQNALKDYFANSSSIHKLGRDISKKVDMSRQEILSYFPEGFDLIFVSSATEANNIITTCLDYKVGGCSEADHPSITAAIKNPKFYKFFKNGRIDYSTISDDVDFLNITHLNSFSGVYQDLKYFNDRKLHVHIDAAQSFGKMLINYKNFDFDSITISGHKMGAPYGVAALIFRRNLKLKPFLKGGGQEYNLRSSSLNAPAIITFAKVIKDLAVSDFNYSKQLSFLQLELKDFLTDWDHQSCIFPILVKNVSADIIVRHLEIKGIMVATSSACSSRIKGVKRFFTALNLNETLHKNVLRISFSNRHTDDDLKFLVNNIKEIYSQLCNY